MTAGARCSVAQISPVGAVSELPENS